MPVNGGTTALTSLGGEAGAFAAAYGAAVMSGALIWKAGSVAEHHVPPWRVATAVSAKSDEDRRAGMCARAAQPRFGLAPTIPTRIRALMGFP